MKRLTAALAVAVLGGALGGCASAPTAVDPLEPMNRAVFKFNDAADRAVLKPVAEGYTKVVPDVARTGVSNFFGNIGDLITVVNSLLQGKKEKAGDSLGRVLVNSSFGILGLFDFASAGGIEKHDEDFGQTLGHWGVGTGPYLVLPLLGPSTVRDSVGRLVDGQADPVAQMSHVPTRNVTQGVRVIDTRAQLLGTEGLLDQAALDKYTFVRGAYLQRRKNLVYDGKPPEDEEEPTAPAEVPTAAPANAPANK